VKVKPEDLVPDNEYIWKNLLRKAVAPKDYFILDDVEYLRSKILYCFESEYLIIKTYNCVAFVGEWTIPAERSPLVGEVSSNFCAQKGVA
jgi:hypothetical protein